MKKHMSNQIQGDDYKKETIESEIYNTLFSKSRVDGIRLINEDEWPIIELKSLFEKVVREAIPIEGKKLGDPVYESGFDLAIRSIKSKLRERGIYI